MIGDLHTQQPIFVINNELMFGSYSWHPPGMLESLFLPCLHSTFRMLMFVVSTLQFAKSVYELITIFRITLKCKRAYLEVAAITPVPPSYDQRAIL
jgi:hypothetical protein